MPHAVLDSGSLTAPSTETAARQLIPGIEPGGSRAGEGTKPALLLRQVRVEQVEWQPDLSAGGRERSAVYLKLSQDQDLNPGLLLPVESSHVETQTAEGSVTPDWHQEFGAEGTLWVAKYVGLRVDLDGSWTGFRVRVHVDYEVVMVPFMDWFMAWEFLDGIPNNSLEY